MCDEWWVIRKWWESDEKVMRKWWESDDGDDGDDDGDDDDGGDDGDDDDDDGDDDGFTTFYSSWGNYDDSDIIRWWRWKPYLRWSDDAISLCSLPAAAFFTEVVFHHLEGQWTTRFPCCWLGTAFNVMGWSILNGKVGGKLSRKGTILEETCKGCYHVATSMLHTLWDLS